MSRAAASQVILLRLDKVNDEMIWAGNNKRYQSDLFAGYRLTSNHHQVDQSDQAWADYDT